jgi:hypothetical protein
VRIVLSQKSPQCNTGINAPARAVQRDKEFGVRAELAFYQADRGAVYFASDRQIRISVIIRNARCAKLIGWDRIVAIPSYGNGGGDCEQRDSEDSRFAHL